MTNKIGEKIKNLRKKANLTQEKVAEYLGVTFQSVSRWERGDAYPDIEILPIIANYFNVTTDELLGVNIMNKRERVNEICLKASQSLTAEESIAILREAVNEFPSEYQLLHNLAFYLMMQPDINSKKEAVLICERILADCTIETFRKNAMQNLSMLYDMTGEKEKAIELAKKLPSMHDSSEQRLAYLYEGAEKIRLLKSNIRFFCDRMTADLTNLAREKYADFTDENGLRSRLELQRKALAVSEILYEDGDYIMHNARMYYISSDMSWIYMVLNEHELALDYIEKTAGYTIADGEFPSGEIIHTSIIFNNNDGEDYKVSKNPASPNNPTHSYIFLQDLADKIYDPIREHERFKAVVAKLEEALVSLAAH